MASVLIIASGRVDIAFPDTRPQGGNFVRPEADQILTVSPPGFSWWRAAAPGEATYRLRVVSSGGDTAYSKEDLQDNIHVPDVVFPTGTYTWIVEAVDGKSKQRFP